jgi:quercetin dioxygenase-like cupin family protein
MTYRTTYRRPGEGTEFFSFDATSTAKCLAADTGGYEVFEVDMPRGPVIPPHSEPWPKAFYQLHGHMRVHLGERSYDLHPGGFIAVAPGTPNTIEVLSPSATFLAFSPGSGMGDFFAEVDRVASRDASPDEVMPAVRQIAARHGIAIAPKAVPR